MLTIVLKEVGTSNAFKAGHTYEIMSLGSSDGVATDAGQNDASAIHRAVTGISNNDTLTVKNLQLMRMLQLRS